MKTGNNILSFHNVDIGYNAGTLVQKGISMDLYSGNLIGLIANNGVGKSTFLKTIAGFMSPLGGKISFNEQVLSGMNLKEVARIVSVVLTGKPQLAGFSVFDVVGMGRYPYTNVFGSLNSSDMQVINACIVACGIENLSEKNCMEISDGEFQKVMVARALAQQTDVLLLDEPTAFLDYSSKRKLFELLKNIAERENKIIVVSSHDIETLMLFTHSAVLLRKDAKPVLYSSEELQTEKISTILN